MLFARRRVAPLIALLAMLHQGPVAAAEALLLFDGETGRKFAGCLNCRSTDETSVCNPVGDYGSVVDDNSIWNVVGPYGSVVETNSPWNPVGEGLRILDQNGNYYGRFTVSILDRSRLPLIQQIVAAYERLRSTHAVRNLLC